MRVLIATTQRGVVGGVETYLCELLPALRRRGHEIGLLYEVPAAPGRAAIDDALPGLPAAHLGADPGVAFVRGFRPDVCYLQGLASPDVEGALVSAVPTVLFAHGYHGTCVSGTKRFAFPVARPCHRDFGAACLGLYFPRRCGGLNPLTMLGLYRLQVRRRALLSSYAGVAVASRAMYDEYRRHGVSPERLRLLPLFPAGQYPDPEPPQEREFSGRVLMAGRFTDLKGGRLLVPAVAAASQALGRPLSLVLAGEGPDLPQMMAAAGREGVAIDYRGWVGPAEREALFRSVDLLAVPSTWPEPFGLVGIEAGCVGLPGAGFGVGGIRDWLLPGETGEMADGDPPTSQGLAAAIARALRDPAHYQRLRVGAWQGARRFSLASHLERLETILGELARGETAAPAVDQTDSGKGVSRPGTTPGGSVGIPEKGGPWQAGT